MKITVNKNLLLRNLQYLNGVIQMNHPLPIMENFLFETAKNRLKITASDLESTVSSEIGIESTGDGTYAIQARMLIDILKPLQDQPLTFDFLDNNTVEVITSTGNYVLAYTDASQYPKTVVLEKPTTMNLPSCVLFEAINSTLFATSNDGLRPVINGVFFQFEADKLTCVATDAHKLVKYTNDDVSALQNAEFIIPKKPLNLLKTILAGSEEQVTVEYNESNAKFSFDNTEMVCRLIDGKYPNYEAVIPKENPNKLIVDRTLFLNAVSCVSVCSSRERPHILLNISGGEMKITAEDVDLSSKAEERLTCDYQGDDIQIGFNSRFLTEMLKNIQGNEVQLEMSEPNRPGILTPVDALTQGEDVLMLLSPLLISQ